MVGVAKCEPGKVSDPRVSNEDRNSSIRRHQRGERLLNERGVSGRAFQFKGVVQDPRAAGVIDESDYPLLAFANQCLGWNSANSRENRAANKFNPNIFFGAIHRRNEMVRYNCGWRKRVFILEGTGPERGAWWELLDRNIRDSVSRKVKKSERRDALFRIGQICGYPSTRESKKDKAQAREQRFLRIRNPLIILPFCSS
jgi:hypothetical protein